MRMGGVERWWEGVGGWGVMLMVLGVWVGVGVGWFWCVFFGGGVVFLVGGVGGCD